MASQVNMFGVQVCLIMCQVWHAVSFCDMSCFKIVSVLVIECQMIMFDVYTTRGMILTRWSCLMYVFARCSEYLPGDHVCEGVLPGVQRTSQVVMFDVCVCQGFRVPAR